MDDKFIFKKIKRRNKSKDFILPINKINLSNSSLKDLTNKPLTKINNKNIYYNSPMNKLNKGAKSVYSIIKKEKNKNRINYFNDKKIFFPSLEETKYAGECNISTIHSNGKFQNLSNNNQEKNSNKVNNKFIIKEKIKRIILNNNDDNNIKLFEKNKKNKVNKEIINSYENDKNYMKNNWKALNISSHYFGNLINDKFGIATNKFSVDKNFILTRSKPIKKYLNNYSTYKKKSDEEKLKFITLNMPDRSNFFNLMSSKNLFSKRQDSINNQKIYENLMHQITYVFKKRIKKYSLLKKYEKYHKSLANDNFSDKNNISNIKYQMLFNSRFSNKNVEIDENKKDKKHIKFNISGRNNSYINKNKDNYKTFHIKIKYFRN